MKPTRGLGMPGWRSISREKRSALLSVAMLLILLGSMALYQRWGALPEQQPQNVDPPTHQTEDGSNVDGISPATETDHPAQEAAGELGAPERLLFPLEGELQVVAPFGSWYSEVFEDYRSNTGIGLRAALGDPVLAAAAGTVTAVEDDPFDGRVVTLQHGGGMETRYAGLEEIVVSAGQRVQVGEVLGKVGTPGPARSHVGPHLFFEVRVGDAFVDPGDYFSQ